MDCFRLGSEDFEDTLSHSGMFVHDLDTLIYNSCQYFAIFTTINYFFTPNFHVILSSVDEPKTGATTSQSSPVPQSFSAKPASMGLDTMNEVADKERFFQDMEGDSSSVDYNKKLKEISTSESADVQNQ